MLRSKARWQVKETDQECVQKLVQTLNITPLLGKLLVNRGITTSEEAQEFLHTTRDFYDPFLLDGMKDTVDRIRIAINEGEKILVFGDYDADGVSSTTLLLLSLLSLGANADYYVPNRFTEGYGPNIPALRKAYGDGVSVVITVDTGISAIEAADAAKDMGLDYIVTDHHEPSPVLPRAYSIINPKKPGCPYPFKELAGVGVAFKLAHALLGQVPYELLDIAVLGTVADLVPLTDENRLIVTKGLIEINRTNRPGIKALLDVAGVGNQTVNSEHLGFSIGPRLNAAGRMGKADPAIELLLSSTLEAAEMLATQLDDANEQRKGIVNALTEEASIRAEQLLNRGERVFVIAGEGWHQGVIGIVASRIVEKYYRPTIILSIDKETGLAKGSARSIEGFDMFQSLSACRELLPHFGGHPMAAGMTLAEVDITNLSNRLNQYAEQVLTDDMLKPLLHIDTICHPVDISLEMIESMNKLAPFGVANPKPKFLLKDVEIATIKQMGAYKNHLKLTIKDDNNQFDTVGFNIGELYNDISPLAQLSVVGELIINEWNGFRKPQLMLNDIAVDHWQLYDLRGRPNVLSFLEGILSDKRRLITFHQKTVQELKLNKLSDEIIYFNNQTENIEEQVYLVLLDLPESVEDLMRLLQQFPQPERIYAVFHSQENYYFSSMPTREHFKWLYSLLVKQSSFPMKELVIKVSKYRGWSQDTVSFMINVFFELGFVKINNGNIYTENDPIKRTLTDSKMYQRKQSRIELESKLFYSSYRSLKDWLQQFYHVSSRVKIPL